MMLTSSHSDHNHNQFDKPSFNWIGKETDTSSPVQSSLLYLPFRNGNFLNHFIEKLSSYLYIPRTNCYTV